MNIVLSNPPTIKEMTANIKSYKTADNFLKIFQELIKENHHFAAFLKHLDAYDSFTYNHSINVGLQTYNLLSQDSKFTKEEVKQWTKAAICHDVGKLAIPLHMLNSTLNYREHPIEGQAEKTVVMSHSIKHSDLGKKYHFIRQDMIAAICHHMKAESIENNFKDAIKAKKEWKEIYKSNELEDFLHETFNSLSNKEITALEMISFCDVCEALRANDRKYKQQKEWETTYEYDKDHQIVLTDKGEPKQNLGIRQLITSDCQQHSLHPKYQKIVKLQSFCDTFDQLQNLNMPAITRNKLRDLTKHIPFTLSDHKIEQIRENPILGKQFQIISDLKYFTFEKGNGERFSFPREHELKDYSNIISKSHDTLAFDSIEKEDIDLELEEID